MTDDETSQARELERLRAERDALRAEVEIARHRTAWRDRGRSWTVVALLVVTCLSIVAAVPATWARRNFLDTDRFTERVAPLVEDPAVQGALTARLTEQVMVLVDPESLFEEALPERGRILAVPLANAVEGFVRDRVEGFVASDRFAELWEASIRAAHEASTRVLRGESELVAAADGEVTLNLLPIIDAVLAEITDASPEVLGRQVDLPDITVDDIPEAALARLEDALDVELGDDFGQLTVYDDGKLEAAQGAVDLLDRLVVVLLVLAVVCAAGALWLSRRRRRTLLQLAAGVVVGMVVVRRVAFTLEDEIAELPPTDQGRGAAEVVVGAFVEPLITFAAWALAVAAVVGLVAVITGAYPWAVALRRRLGALSRRLASTTTERARDEATVQWVAEHRDPLLLTGALVGLILLWILDLSWAGLLALVVVVGAYEAAVFRTAGSVSPEHP